DAAPLVPMARVERGADALRQATQALCFPRPTADVCELRCDLETAGELRIQRGGFAVPSDVGPIHEMPIRHVGHQAVFVEQSLEPRQRLEDGRKYGIDG